MLFLFLMSFCNVFHEQVSPYLNDLGICLLVNLSSSHMITLGFSKPFKVASGYGHSPETQAPPRGRYQMQCLQNSGLVGGKKCPRLAYLTNPATTLCVLVFSARTPDSPAFVVWMVGHRRETLITNGCSRFIPRCFF